MLKSPKTHTTRLDNGIRVITERVSNTRSAGISILVDAGPQDEEANKLGLAHLCEHALFLGTPQRSSLELAKTIDAAGGCFGAFTAPDYTCFYAHILEDYVSYAFDLLGDILVASKYPEELLEREKEVVRQEILGYQDNPNDALLQMTKQSLWPNDPLSRSVTGTVEDVSKLQRADVVQFVSRQYSPDRIIVAAAGALEHDSIVEQTQDAFWTLRGQNPPRSNDSPFDPKNSLSRVRVKNMPIGQCSFSIAIPTVPYNDERRYAMHLINNLIGGGMSSRLYQHIREANGLVYSIQSSLLSYRRGGAMVISGETSVDKLIQSIHLTLSQLTALAIWENPIQEEELWKSKMQVRSQSRLATDFVSNRVSGIATQEFHFGYRIEEDQIVNEIDQVSIDELEQVACGVLFPGLGRLAISAVGPIDEGSAVYNDLLDIHSCYSSLACVKI